MDSKRKMNGGAAEELDDRASKRRRTLPDQNGETAEATTQLGLKLITQISDMTDRTGRSIAENFFELPPKRDLPDYYQIIKMPVALDTIELKLKRHELPTLTALESLLHRMVENARVYNEEDSLIVADAEKIRKAVSTFMKKENTEYKTGNYTPFPTPIPGVGESSGNVDADVEDEDEDEGDSTSTPISGSSKRRGRPPKDPNHPYHTIKATPRAVSGTPGRSNSQVTDGSVTGQTFQSSQDRIVTELITHKELDEDDFSAFEPFLNLPPRSLKDYYQNIPHPVCLKGLQKRVRGVHGRNDPTGISDFKTWAAFEEEASLIWKNAQHYNEDGSDIYVLANDLKNYFYKLFNKAKQSVPEPSGPKLKLKMSAPEPTPKITLRMGNKASPAESPAQTPSAAVSQTSQNGVAGKMPYNGHPQSETVVVGSLDRARSMSGAVASPSPSTAGLVKHEDGARPSAIINGVPGAAIAVTPAFNQGLNSIPVNGTRNSMMPPSNSGVNGTIEVTPTISYQPQASLPPPPPPQPQFYEQRLRQPGKTAADAMITNIHIRTHPGLNIPQHFRMDIPPSDEEAQLSVTVNLPPTHYFLQIQPTIAESMLDRQHKIFVTAGINRLHGLPNIPGQPLDQRRPMFEVRLQAGVTRIELEIIAALPKGAPRPSNGSDVELEKVTIFTHLLRK